MSSTRSSPPRSMFIACKSRVNNITILTWSIPQNTYAVLLPATVALKLAREEEKRTAPNILVECLQG